MKRSTALILVLISVALFFTFTRPQYQNVKEISAIAGEYRNVIDNVEKIAETRDRLLVNYEAIPNAEIDRLSKILPDNVDSVRLALDLETIASRYGISIRNVAVETDTNKGATLPVLPEYALPYEKVVISFSFISNYDNFTKMLTDLEKSLRIMDVKGASFKTSDSGLYEHDLTVETYWLK